MVIVQHFGPRDLAVLTDRYANNDRLAVFAVENGEPYTDLSVNMPEEALADGEFIFKTYTENEGLFDQFVASGAVEFTGRYTESRVALPICRLTIQADR